MRLIFKDEYANEHSRYINKIQNIGNNILSVYNKNPKEIFRSKVSEPTISKNLFKIYNLSLGNTFEALKKIDLSTNKDLKIIKPNKLKSLLEKVKVPFLEKNSSISLIIKKAFGKLYS